MTRRPVQVRTGWMTCVRHRRIDYLRKRIAQRILRFYTDIAPQVLQFKRAVQYPQLFCITFVKSRSAGISSSRPPGSVRDDVNLKLLPVLAGTWRSALKWNKLMIRFGLKSSDFQNVQSLIKPINPENSTAPQLPAISIIGDGPRPHPD